MKLLATLLLVFVISFSSQAQTTLTPDTNYFCLGTTTTVSSGSSGGSWLCSDPAVATVDALSGAFAALSVGTATLTYTTGATNLFFPVDVDTTQDAGTILSPDSICLGSTLTVSNTATGGVWTGSSGLSMVSDCVFMATLPGVDTVWYSVTVCGTAVASKVISALQMPFVAPIAGPTQVCNGTAFTLTEAVPGGTWSASISYDSISDGVFVITAVGNGVFIYTISNFCGADSAFASVSVVTTPDVVVSTPDIVCLGDSVLVTATPEGGTWFATNTKAVISGNYIKGLATGLDTLVYVVTNECGEGDAGKFLVVESKPTPSVTAPNPFCVTKPDTAWGLPGGGIWSATDTSLFDTALVHNGIFKAVMSGTDTLLYTVSNYCGSVTDSLPVHIFTKAQCDSVNGISEFADRDTDGFSIFPNPSNGTLHIAVNTANGQPFNIAILNTLGQKVWAQTYNAAKNSSSFVVELEDHLKSGFYYIVLTNNEIRNTKSFMLQR